MTRMSLEEVLKGEGHASWREAIRRLRKLSEFIQDDTWCPLWKQHIWRILEGRDE